MTRRFDVFLSHSSVDTLWVHRLAGDLARYEVSVWSDEGHARHGDSSDQTRGGPDGLQQALDMCGAMVLVVSPESLASGWVAETYAVALALAQRKDAALHLIPVLVHGAELPDFLAQRSAVEFRDAAGYATAVWHLVWGITGEKPAHALALEAPDAPHAAPIPMASADSAPVPY